MPPFDSHYPFSGLGLVETGNRVAGRTQQRQIGLRTSPCCTHRILAPRHDRCMLSLRRTAKRIKEAADNHEVGWDLLSWCFTSTVTRFIRDGEQSGTERSRDRELWESRSGRPGLPRPYNKPDDFCGRKREPVWPSGKAKAGKRKDLGSMPLRLSILFEKVVVCGHCLVTLSITSCWNIKMALIAAHLNAEVILVVTV